MCPPDLTKDVMMKPLLPRLLSLSSVATLACWSFTGCGATSTQAHRASIDEHERAADRNEAMAAEYEIRSEGAEGAIGDHSGHVDLWMLALSARRHAEAHRRAAELLAESEDPHACVGVPRAALTECPLEPYAVSDYTETEDGVIVTYSDVEADNLRQHVRCHVAHADMTSEPHDGASACPLVGDVVVTVEEHPGGTRLTVTAESSDERERLRGLYRATDSHELHGHK